MASMILTKIKEVPYTSCIPEGEMRNRVAQVLVEKEQQFKSQSDKKGELSCEVNGPSEWTRNLNFATGTSRISFFSFSIDRYCVMTRTVSSRIPGGPGNTRKTPQ